MQIKNRTAAQLAAELGLEVLNEADGERSIILYNGEDYGIVVNKMNQELLKKINSGLAKIKANGKFKEIHVKWFKVEE